MSTDKLAEVPRPHCQRLVHGAEDTRLQGTPIWLYKMGPLPPGA